LGTNMEKENNMASDMDAEVNEQQSYDKESS